MRYAMVSLLMVSLAGCGEDTPCDKLVDIWKKICSVNEGSGYPCFPCSCALCGQRWDISLRLGIPNIADGICYPFSPCEDADLEWAETCLESAPPPPYELGSSDSAWRVNECDPRSAYGVWLASGDCADYNPATPELIDKGRETADCGR